MEDPKTPESNLHASSSLNYHYPLCHPHKHTQAHPPFGGKLKQNAPVFILLNQWTGFVQGRLMCYLAKRSTPHKLHYTHSEEEAIAS